MLALARPKWRGMGSYSGLVGIPLLLLAQSGCSSGTAATEEYDVGLDQEHLSNAQEAEESPRVNWWQGGRTQRNTNFNPLERFRALQA
jgi:hypothetical protein